MDKIFLVGFVAAILCAGVAGLLTDHKIMKLEKRIVALEKREE